jgi:hypothetical protein
MPYGLVAAVAVDLQNSLALLGSEALGGGLLRSFELSGTGCARLTL